MSLFLVLHGSLFSELKNPVFNGASVLINIHKVSKNVLDEI